MSKSYTIEQLETFVINFAKCFFSNASLAFKIENSKTKNKFYLCLIDQRKIDMKLLYHIHIHMSKEFQFL